MKRVPSGGYTIIEVMIFLVVSSALLTSVMLMVNGKQERTRFTQTVNTLDQDLRDVFNDVSTGYYPSGPPFNCRSTSAGSPPVNSVILETGNTEQGSNAVNGQGCIFLGKAIELGQPPDKTRYNTYTLVASKNATNLGDAGTVLLGTPSANNFGVIDRDEILADIEVVDVVDEQDSGRAITGLALVSEFSETAAVTEKITGNATRLTLYEIPPDFLTNAGKNTMQIPEKGIYLCLRQGSGLFARTAAIKIDKNLTTEVLIDQWPSGCEA